MFGTYQRLNVNVLASNLTVIRALRCKLRPEVLHDRSKRDARHALYRTILTYHSKAAFIAREWRL